MKRTLGCAASPEAGMRKQLAKAVREAHGFGNLAGAGKRAN